MDDGDKYADLVERLHEIGLTEDPDLLVETTQLFLNDAAQMVEAMKTALAKGDATALVRASHRLKGAALNLGATRVAAPARTIEEGARRSGMADVAASVNAIEEELKCVGTFMKGFAKASAKV